MVVVEAWVGMGVVVGRECDPPLVCAGVRTDVPCHPQISRSPPPRGECLQVLWPNLSRCPPPWRQFVPSMGGGRGQVSARGRPTSGRKHLAAPPGTWGERLMGSRSS